MPLTRPPAKNFYIYVKIQKYTGIKESALGKKSCGGEGACAVLLPLPPNLLCQFVVGRGSSAFQKIKYKEKKNPIPMAAAPPGPSMQFVRVFLSGSSFFAGIQRGTPFPSFFFFLSFIQKTQDSCKLDVNVKRHLFFLFVCF